MKALFSVTKVSVAFSIFCAFWFESIRGDDEIDNKDGSWSASNIAPSVMVVFFVRNKAHTLPWFLNYLERLDYPKERMRLWIRSDHNVDSSVSILKEWLGRVQNKYNSVDFVDDKSETSYSDAEGPFDWSKKRVRNMLRLRQEALNAVRNSWADYLLFTDCDNFLLNNQTLKILLKSNKLVVAPKLNVTASAHYSNFWGEMNSEGYYQRSDDYTMIKDCEKLGIFQVAVVHSTFLIEIRSPATRGLAYDPPPMDYQAPMDDIIIFAHSAKHNNVSLFISNEHSFGVMLVPMESHNTIDQERQQFVHLKLEMIVLDVPFEKLPYLNVSMRVPDKLGFDEIYMINLIRRPDRRSKMVDCFRELGINATLVDAVDGKLLNQSYIKSLGVKVVPSYADPYHGTRTMTAGEIGCFLSHYFIWLDVLTRQLSKVIVFEDDVRFRIYFKERLKYLVGELDEIGLAWDLMYIGRKKLYESDEPAVANSQNLVWPLYSYWTIGYALTYTGAWKLVQEDPLKKLVPVDEYIPIMFDKHPREDWKTHFRSRNLVAISTNPLLIEPTLYTGEAGYFTDTEDSITMDELASHTKKRGDTDPVPPLESLKFEL